MKYLIALCLVTGLKKPAPATGNIEVDDFMVYGKGITVVDIFASGPGP